MKKMEFENFGEYIQNMPDFTKQANDRFNKSIENYRSAGIDIQTIGVDEGNLTLKVRIAQSRLLNGYILNQKQLVQRAQEVYQDMGWKINVIPVVYSLDVDEITIPWIENRMEELGIKRNDLIKQLAIDKASLSKIFTGITGLSKPMRALFYYYFLTYELNRDLREAV